MVITGLKSAETRGVFDLSIRSRRFRVRIELLSPGFSIQSGRESTIACMADNDARVGILRKFPRKESKFSVRRESKRFSR